MSRVDDDRDAERVAARLTLQKRAEEQKTKDRAVADSAFSRLVTTQKTEAKKTENDKLGKNTIAALLHSAELDKHLDVEKVGEKEEMTEHTEKGTAARLGGKAKSERTTLGTRVQGEQLVRVKADVDQGQNESQHGRAQDGMGKSQTAQARASDARTNKETLDGRSEDADHSDDAHAGAAKGKGGLKTDADKGGGGQQQGGKDQKGSDVPANFRFNPALAAPVPIAKKNEAQGNDRLRRLAAEIAQKIVERVRVGTNALGNAEFQIDLRQDVMGGMSVKVSAKNGKISAVFSGSDRQVLKQLEAQADSLKGALSARGLTLESLKVEARA